MPLPTVSFVLGVGVLFYLSTFVLFALLRIITGVSIQRISYSGLRRIAFSPRDGVSIRIRGIGVSLHRPTFAQPTWISLTLTEPRIIVDLAALRASQNGSPKTHGNVSPSSTNGHADAAKRGGRKGDTKNRGERALMFTRLIEWKERIKKLHRQVEWLRQVDLLIVRASLQIHDVGALRIERLVLSVDTRPKTVDRSRLFQHRKTKSNTQRPAEWKCIMRSLLFTTEGKDSIEVVDYCTLSVHGFLVKELEGLRDASIALKMGRTTIPYDEIEAFADRLNSQQSFEQHSLDPDVPGTPIIQKDGEPFDDSDLEPLGETAVNAINDSKDFASSILRGIHEVQLAVSFFGLSKRIKSLHTSGQQVYFNVAMKEVGLDLMRLDPRSPAHRQYFSPKDVAHQALLTAISIAAGVDDGQEHPERMLYVPMVTATIKTTLPSKILQVSANLDPGDTNTNILFANLVCTSPSIDLDPKHLPLILAMARSKRETQSTQTTYSSQRRSSALLARLLPKAIIKIAVQEPVIRVSLPHRGEESEYDMIISSVSSMAMDIEAQHDLELKHHYSLSINYRHTNHRLYGQTYDGDRHELLFADTVEFKLDVNAFPETTVTIAGKFQNFSLYLTEPEICEGLRQIILSMKKELMSHHKTGEDQAKISFLRRAPAWLHHVHVEGSDFNVEITSIEPSISKFARGASFHLSSWSVEHKVNREEVFQTVTRRRSTSRVSQREHSPKQGLSDSPKKRQISPTDGRRLAVHIEGLEGLIIDSTNDSTGDSFLALPRFEVAFSTSTDAHGPILHINAKAEKLYVLYSLYNVAALGIAYLLAKKTFMPAVSDSGTTNRYNSRQVEYHASLSPPSGLDSENRANQGISEIVTVDFRAGLLQLKATMPADPPLMLQIYGLEAGQHRWATPFAKTKLSRLYAGTPGMQSVWSRIVSMKGARLDIRTMRRKAGKQTVDEKSLDITAEGIRFGVPHQLVVHAIFDNLTNVVKVHEQLYHTFITGRKDYILEKHPEGPKHVPKISLKTQVFMFELEDSPFEYKLGIIYRNGLLEQHQRLAREEAFRLKVKKMRSKRQEKNGQGRARSARPLQRDRTTSDPDANQRSRSASARPGDRRYDHMGKLRYDTQGRCEMGGSICRSVDQARDTLDRFNASSWKSRIDRAWTCQRHAIKEIRSFIAGMDVLPEEWEETEPILAMSLRPGLLSLCISDLSIVVDKPTYPLQDLPAFMHDVGKGMPLDMEYGLLIPMHLQVSMGEARAVLRDYPLPLLHIPAIRAGQSPRLPSLSLTTNFVIAEEFRDHESQRQVQVTIIPSIKVGPDNTEDGFSVNVRRTVSPVKTYSNMKIDISTSAPTRITWGTSYQPAIQDMMQVIEGFTKPPIDPSEAVGFWDKIRLSFHSRIVVSWKADGDVHLNLKGSRDPYIVTGDGSGFVMVWRNNVCCKLAQDPDPRKFMTVDSGDYILAIPDYDHYARHMLDTEDVSGDASDLSTADSLKASAMFKKVIMKLSGNVQWLLGLMFEQSTEDGKRHFDFRNHYDIVFKHPDYAKCPKDKTYDAFRGFRSQHIHMSMTVTAPHSREWNVLNVKPSDNYNSVHLSPRFFTHFIKWWSLFSGVMSLPVRQGRLWGGQEKTSKKFGRHLATLKYNLMLSPVFISHMYKHKDVEDFATDSVAVTGLKMKIDSLMLDLHQRREFFETTTPGGDSKKTSSMRINQGQLDFISADFRAVSSTVKGTSKEDVDAADESEISTFQSTPAAVDMSQFTIPDNDFTWIDMDDFVELDWILPQESNPETKILPLGKAPRFTYFRQTDHGGAISGDSARSSPFGDEPTHFCVMTQKNDPRRVQADLIQERLEKIVEQIENNERATGEQELKVIRDPSNGEKMQEKLEALKRHSETLKAKHAFLHGMHKTLLQRLEDDDAAAVPVLETQEPALNREESEWRDVHMTEGLNSIPSADDSRDFNNRFVVHNPQIKWNNSLRNIILRYIHQVGQRRGFVYYMSRRAVKFILDIVEEKKRSSPDHPEQGDRQDSQATTPMVLQQDDEMTVEDRIEQILADGRDFVEADDGDRQRSKSGGGGDQEEISADFLAQSSYYFRLIAPQIQLQSEKNPKSVVLLAAKGIHLKVIQIMDKDRLLDEISGLVQRRFNAAMDSMQVFVTSTKTFSTDYLHMYSGNRYGTKAGTFWPPWVPMEVMYEFSNSPYGFSRVVQRTSASLKLDKYNNLRLKYNDDISNSQGQGQHHTDASEHRMDHLSVEFPQFRAICDSSQYFAMYIIVVDLLLYNEPLEKTRSERLEKIMLASDFSDLTGAPELVEMLQGRIRQLEEIKMHFQIHEGLLDRQGWKDRISMDQDLTSCEDELFFMMKAITTSQQKTEDRGVQEGSRGILHWFITAKEVAWHLVREQEQKFLEFQIRDTSFERTDNSDGSNQNSVEFGRINGYNFLPNAVYRELIAPYVNEKEGLTETRDKMLRVQWLMMEAIAGIPVVDYFEVDLVPVQVQLEREVAKRLFEYLFPGAGGSAFEGAGFSPFVVKKLLPSTEDSDEESPISDAPIPTTNGHDTGKHHQGTGTGAGTLEQRLKPTLHLSEPKQSPKHKHKGLGISEGHNSLSSHWSLFQNRSKSQLSVQRRVTSNPRQQSSGSLSATLSRSNSNTSFDDSNTSISDKKKTLGSSTTSIRKSADLVRGKSKPKDTTPNDDLTQMLTRASSYITLSYFHIHSLILCLSYKGQGKRNIEDVHDLVFRLPSIEYRNKTWSNLDLAMELKREVLRALVGHAGRIVGNKFRSAPKRVSNKVDGLRESLLLGTSSSRSDAGSGGGGVASRPASTHHPVTNGDHKEKASSLAASDDTRDKDGMHFSDFDDDDDEDDDDSNVSSDAENDSYPPTLATARSRGLTVSRAQTPERGDDHGPPPGSPGKSSLGLGGGWGKSSGTVDGGSDVHLPSSASPRWDDGADAGGQARSLRSSIRRSLTRGSRSGTVGSGERASEGSPFGNSGEEGGGEDGAKRRKGKGRLFGLGSSG